MGLGEVGRELNGLLVIAGRFVHKALGAQAVALFNGLLRGVCPVLRVPVRAAHAEGDRQRGGSYVKEAARHWLAVEGLVCTTAGRPLSRS